MIPGVSQFGNAVKKVGGYVGNVLREARDIPTAIGTGMGASFDQQNSRPGYNQKEVSNSMKASANNSKQIGEVFGALKGQKGTRSDQFNSKGNYVMGSKLGK